MLNTFVLVHKNKVISPMLVTTREYGRWLESYYDSSICSMELYLKSKKSGDEVVLESHPGTKIGKWFDSHTFNSADYLSWFILQDSTMMQKLVKYSMAEQRDAIPISVNDKDHRRMIRVYTAKQIELYIKSNIDSAFKIAEQLMNPRQIKILDSDYAKLIMPEVKHKRKQLF